MTTINPFIPQFVLDAALTLHKQRNTNLSYDLVNVTEPITIGDTLLWNRVGDRIEFVNLEARNQCTASAVFQQAMPFRTAGELFNAAYELWQNEIGHPDLAAGRLLGLASESMNVLMEAAQSIKNKQHASEVFRILHLIEASLPHLSKIGAKELIAVVDAQHESTKRDVALGPLLNAIEQQLRTQPQLAWDILSIVRENISESVQSLYSTAMQALMSTDQLPLALKMAREDSDHINPLIESTALWTLGRAIQFNGLNTSDADECAAILKNKVHASNTNTQQAAIRAIAQAALKNSQLMSELVRLAKEPSDYTLTAIANFLHMNQRDLPASSPHLDALLAALVKLSPSHNSAIDKLDWVLHQLYKTPEIRPKVLEHLTQWIILHGSASLNDKTTIELFDQTITQIANDKSGLQEIITRWLVAPEKQLAVACGGLISYLDIRGVNSLTFSPEVLSDLPPQDFKFLARRLLGYVISESPLLSLTLSLLDMDNAPARSFGWVYSLLTDEIGRDYPYATMEALEARQEVAISPEKELLQQAHAIILKRSTANDGLPKLQELRPSIRLRRAISLSQARQMEQAREAADENSIARALFTQVPLKAGTGCFSVSNNEVGPVNHLHSFSYSATLPRRSITDPAGYAIAGLCYRIVKRDDK